MERMKLGSLFDGSGGFPLAGVMNGIEPVWASEIEPFPIRVTTARFPHMKHLGDVTKIRGDEIEAVDIITFGSPCQDLSVAGKQAGIHEGERSNLFFEAVRIIKEMRQRDKLDGRTGVDIRPRFAVWENVPGAFSSGKGEDFKAVLEALGGVCEDGLSIPRPKKWNHSGCVVGHGWSIAWRLYDAQYWGVPQRRKRIYLVADFGSERAGEILFERESVSGHPEQGGEAWQRTAGDAERGADGDGGVRCLNPWDAEGKRIFSSDGCMQTLFAGEGGHLRGVLYPNNEVRCLNPWDVQSKHIMTPDGQCEALCSGEKRWGALPPNVCFQLCGDRDNPNVSVSENAYCIPANPMSDRGQGVCYALQGNGIDRADTAGCNGSGWRSNEMYTLNTIDRPAVVFQQPQALTNRGYPCGEVTETLRADSHQALPICCMEKSVFFDAFQHYGYRENVTSGPLTTGLSTIRGDTPIVAQKAEDTAGKSAMFDNHSQDSRYTGPVDVSQTVSATFGAGGNNTPYVVEERNE